MRTAGRARARTQRAADRAARWRPGPAIDRASGRDQGRHDAAGRPLGDRTAARKHLLAACEASRRALGVERIDLYQLHAPDPRTPLATSVRALAALKRDGAHRRDRPLQRDRRSDRGGAADHRDRLDPGGAERLAGRQHPERRRRVLRRATALPLLAYRPLGGRRSRARTAADPVLERDRGAARRNAVRDRARVAASISRPAIVPMPGVTRVETAESVGASRSDRADRRGPASASTTRFPQARPLRAGASRRLGAGTRGTDAEVVLVMGLPGAGKTTLAERFVADGYQRLNRDEAGGTLRDLLPALDRALAVGRDAYRPRQHLRVAQVARAKWCARQRTAASRCAASGSRRRVEDAQVNAASRLRGAIRQAARPTRSWRRSQKAGCRRVCCRRCSSATSASSNRRTLPRAFRESMSSRSSDGRIPPTSNRAVIVWCDDVLFRSRSGARTPSHSRGHGCRRQSRGRPAPVSRRRVAGARPVVAAGDRRRHSLGGRCGWRPRTIEPTARIPIRCAVLSPRRRPAAVLVSKAASRIGRAVHPSIPARSGTVPLRRCRIAGSWLRPKARVHIS